MKERYWRAHSRSLARARHAGRLVRLAGGSSPPPKTTSANSVRARWRAVVTGLALSAGPRRRPGRFGDRRLGLSLRFDGGDDACAQGFQHLARFGVARSQLQRQVEPSHRLLLLTLALIEARQGEVLFDAAFCLPNV